MIPEIQRLSRHAHSILALLVVMPLVAACENTVEPRPTSGELIREILVTGGDESILFSTAILRDQTGTTAYARTIDSQHRGFVNPRFYEETTEDPGALAFEAEIYDTLWGTLTFNVQNLFGPSTIVTRPYVKAAYGGLAKLLDNSCFTCANPWRIWRMRYRKADQPNGSGDPKITSMTVARDTTYRVVGSPFVRINRDSVITVKLDSLVNINVRVESDAPDDTFFITYPVASGTYQTVAMAHNVVDSLGHTATVGVRSLNRYELVAVQGFKRQALQDTLYNQAAASAIQTAIVAFR